MIVDTSVWIDFFNGHPSLQAQRLTQAIEDKKRADKAGALLVIVGSINVPIIYFSVKWWNTLHQGASVSVTGSKMASMMALGMLVMALACWMYAIAVVLVRVRAIILERRNESEHEHENEHENENANSNRAENNENTALGVGI